MVIPQLARLTVGCVDDYCEAYRHLFGDVRNFESFKLSNSWATSVILKIDGFVNQFRAPPLNGRMVA